MPQFEFLEVLFGSEPVLDPKERLYQRLLAGDPDEATDQAEEILEEDYLEDYYGKVAIPALLLAEQDRQRGVLKPGQIEQVSEAAMVLVSNLEEIAREEEQEEEGEEADAPAGDVPVSAAEESSGAEEKLPDGAGKMIFCIGGRGPLDDVSAAMLAQVLQVQGANVVAARHSDITRRRSGDFVPEGTNVIVVCFLNEDSTKHAGILLRRFKRMHPASRVGLVLWSESDEERRVPVVKEAEFLASSLTEAAREALSDIPPSPATSPRQIRIRRPVARSGSGAVGAEV